MGSTSLESSHYISENQSKHLNRNDHKNQLGQFESEIIKGTVKMLIYQHVTFATPSNHQFIKNFD